MPRPAVHRRSDQKQGHSWNVLTVEITAIPAVLRTNADDEMGRQHMSNSAHLVLKEVGESISDGEAKHDCYGENKDILDRGLPTFLGGYHQLDDNLDPNNRKGSSVRA